MNDLQVIAEEKSVVRWGGLAGIAGSIILIIVFVIVGVFVGESPATHEGYPIRFPSVRTARTIENSLYMVTLALWVIHFLALNRALRATKPAAALFGSALGIIGLILLMTGAIPHIATSRLSDLYHASAATPADQATVVLLWQATNGIFEALLLEGLVLLPLALIILGIGMRTAPSFGKGFGGISLVIGLAGAVAAIVLMIDPRSLIAVVSVLGLIIFHLALGWKNYTLSRTI